MAIVLKALDDVAWESKIQPAWNNARALPDALRNIGAAESGDAAAGAYHEFLYAIGNNHAGTYYPVVLDTVPFLASFLEANESSRETVLDIVIDLLGSFGPEVGYEVVDTGDGTTVDLRVLLHRSMASLRPKLEALSSDASSPTRTREMARDALALLSRPIHP